MKMCIRPTGKLQKAYVEFHREVVLDEVAELAMQLVERWLTAACEDGEDSEGRAKMRLLMPNELTDRAFSIATSFYKKAHEYGHLLDVPDTSDD